MRRPKQYSVGVDVLVLFKEERQAGQCQEHQTRGELELVHGLPKMFLRHEKDSGKRYNAYNEYCLPQICPPSVFVLAYPRQREAKVTNV